MMPLQTAITRKPAVSHTQCYFIPVSSDFKIFFISRLENFLHARASIAWHILATTVA